MMRQDAARLVKAGALALAIAVGGVIWFSPVKDTSLTVITSGAALADATAPATVPLPEVSDMVLGKDDAPVTVIEYASYTCPHCAHFHEDVFKDLKKDYIDTGKVKFVYREVYFDRYGLWAAMLARCGGPTRYFGINAMLFEQQKQWPASEDPTAVVANLKKIGRTAGMDDATLTACLQDATMAQALVAKFQETTKADGIDGTPTLIINGEKHPNMTYEDLKKILDAKLG